jgi:hypothetical protein
VHIDNIALVEIVEFQISYEKQKCIVAILYIIFNAFCTLVIVIF